MATISMCLVLKNPNANGKYRIVTVDYTGQAMVTDPNITNNNVNITMMQVKKIKR